MATHSLDDNSYYARFFRKKIGTNLQYWHRFLNRSISSIENLDGERACIINAISYGLSFDETWDQVYQLMIPFSLYIEKRGPWKVWHQLLIQAIDKAQSLKEIDRATTLSILLAKLLQRQQQYPLAISQYKQAIKLARQTNNLYEEARACTNLGYLYIEESRFYRARILCCYALDIFNALNNNHGLAHTENHLGMLCIRQEDWAQAQQHLQRACEIWQIMNDDYGLMYGLINLGLLYDEMQQPQQAIDYLEKALQIANSTGDELNTAVIYMNMGVAYRYLKNFRQSEYYARQAETIFKQKSNLHRLADVWGNLGLVYSNQKKWLEAQFYLDISLKTHRQLQDKSKEIDTLLYQLEYELVQMNDSNLSPLLNELDSLIAQHGRPKQKKTLLSLFSQYNSDLSRRI